MTVRNGIVRLFLAANLISLFFLSTINVYSQGEIDDRQKILIRNERSFGFILNSNGYGLDFRYGKRTSGFKKDLYGIDFNYLKHPKEIKTNSYFYNNKSYVYGKLNSFYTLHLSYGRQHEIFSKFDKGGVAINYFYQIGPSIGILKPKLYDVAYPGDDSEYVDFESFYHTTQNFHTGFIKGNAPFFEGIENTKIVPGIFVKGGVNFEFSSSDQYINALEAGVTIDLYPDDIPIMFSEENDYQQVFVSLFIVYRIGKILNGRSIAKD